MTRNPLYNALAASGYIVGITLLLSLADKIHSGPDSIIIPMIMLSLFTLSAAVMGYIFFFQPVLLYLEGKIKEAIALFMRTTAIFAAITLVLVLLYLLGLKF